MTIEKEGIKLFLDGVEYVPKASHSSDSGGQKDWEIVDGGLSERSKYKWDINYNPNNLTIRSVKRLSDNVTFSVGERVEGVYHKKPFTIEKIEIINTDFIYLDSCPLRNAVKLPPERSKDDFENIDRPPLGLLPTKFWKTARLNEIESAIIRYVNARREIPQEWLLEREELLAWVKSLNLKWDIKNIK